MTTLSTKEKEESFEENANKLRREGNDLLQANNTEQAIDRYTESLEACLNVLTLSNRAQAYLKLGRLILLF